jgi:hypothetical protein
MPKQFFTERDIEDLAARGQFSLTMSEDVVLTELAFEKAERLGVKLIQPHALPPSSPVRPYLSEDASPKPVCKPCSEKASKPEAEGELRQRIRTAVKAKMGSQVDDTLLETIITRVLNNVGVK